MYRLDRWVSPINILFFVLSGAELDLTILTNPMVLPVSYTHLDVYKRQPVHNAPI